MAATSKMANQDVQNVPRGVWGAALVFLLVVGAACVAFQPVFTMAAIGVAAAFLVCCSERRLKFALFALAIYTPFEGLVLKWIPAGVYAVAPGDLFFVARFGYLGFLLGCFAALLVFRLLAGRSLWVRTPVDVPLALFLGVSALSCVVNSVWLSGALISYQTFLRYIIVVFYLLFFIRFDRRDAVVLTVVLFAVVFLESVIGIAQSFIGPAANAFLAPGAGEFGDYRVGALTQPMYTSGFQVYATLGRYNVLGAFLAFFLVMSVPFFQDWPKVRPWLLLVYVVAVPCLVLTAARGPCLAAVAGLWVVLAARRQWTAVLLPVAGLLCLMAVLTVYEDQVQFVGTRNASVLQRFLEVFSARYLDVIVKYHGRLYFLLLFPFDMIRLGPVHVLFGFGPGMVGDRAVALHNVNVLGVLGIRGDAIDQFADVYWSYVLAQAGIIALAALLWMCVRLFRAALQVYRQATDPFLKALALGLLGGLTVQMVAACFGPVWENRPVSLYVWLYAAIVFKLGYAYVYPSAAGPGTNASDTPPAAPRPETAE